MMHKLHGQMCTMSSWCTHSELKAPSEYSKYKSTDKGFFTKNNVLPEYHGECWCQMLYWLVVTRLCNTHSLVECKNYARSAKGLGANWPTKLLQHMHSATP